MIKGKYNRSKYAEKYVAPRIYSYIVKCEKNISQIYFILLGTVKTGTEIKVRVKDTVKIPISLKLMFTNW